MSGSYDEHSAYQRAVAETGADRITRCVDAVPISEHDAFLVTDYGCSSGANSMASVATAVAAVRARRADRPIVALHNDLATNDWNQLFGNVTATHDGVLHLASAVSFFEPSAPPRSVHLGVSFSAAHWLRTQPDVVIPNGFYFCEATGATRARLAAQADTDWTAFLAARAADLASGGRILVQMVGTEVDAGDAEAKVTARTLLRAMAEVAAEMAKEGTLDPTVVDHYVLGAYARTVEEARAPLTREGSPLKGLFTEVECRTDAVPNPYYTKWQRDGDAAAYATAYAAFVRGFTESSLRDHLFTPGVRGTTVDAALDDFFARLAARFRADPERDRFEDWTLTVVLART
jgi:hypothetical protein